MVSLYSLVSSPRPVLYFRFWYFIRIQWTKMNGMATLALTHIVLIAHEFTVSHVVSHALWYLSISSSVNKKRLFLHSVKKWIGFSSFIVGRSLLERTTKSPIFFFSVSIPVISCAANEPDPLRAEWFSGKFIYFSFSFSRKLLMCTQSTLTVL